MPSWRILYLCLSILHFIPVAYFVHLRLCNFSFESIYLLDEIRGITPPYYVNFWSSLLYFIIDSLVANAVPAQLSTDLTSVKPLLLHAWLNSSHFPVCWWRQGLPDLNLMQSTAETTHRILWNKHTFLFSQH